MLGKQQVEAPPPSSFLFVAILVCRMIFARPQSSLIFAQCFVTGRQFNANGRKSAGLHR
jgi:hypothetical protein